MMSLFVQRATTSVRVALAVLILLLCSCAELPRKGWGGDVSVTPGWGKFKRAAINAAKDPGTWVPALGAVYVLASGQDDDLTQRAIDDNWLYASRYDAILTSDDHRAWLDKVWMVSLLATDSGEGDWFANKAAGMVTQAAIVNVSIGTTNLLKSVTTRASPMPTLNEDDYQGFPSNHSVPPFTQAALIRRNLRYTAVSDFTRYSIITGSYLLAGGSAYGRVEGGLHFFSDQLAGAALGNFIGLLLFDTFFEEEGQWGATLYPVNNNKGLVVQFIRRF